MLLKREPTHFLATIDTWVEVLILGHTVNKIRSFYRPSNNLALALGITFSGCLYKLENGASLSSESTLKLQTKKSSKNGYYLTTLLYKVERFFACSYFYR